MGETEDEFARAEALLQQLETRDNNPVQSTLEEVPIPSTPQSYGIQPSDILPGQVYQVTSDYVSFVGSNSIMYRDSTLGSNSCPVLDTGEIIPIRLDGSVESLRTFRYSLRTYGSSRIVHVFYFKVLDIQLQENRIRVQVGNNLLLDWIADSRNMVSTPIVLDFKLGQFIALSIGGNVNLITNRGQMNADCKFDFYDADLIKVLWNDKKEAEKARIEEELRLEEERRRAPLEFLAKTKEELEPLLEGIYPGHWDIRTHEEDSRVNSYRSDYNFQSMLAVTIKFDEITITNTRRQSHIIRDLYVRTYIGVKDGEPRMLGHMDGCRGQQTSKEFFTRYRHSHLGTGSYGWTNFCVGSSTATSIALSELNLKFDMLKYELLLYQISTYVAWESIEGGPYIRMENISGRNRTTITPNLQLEIRNYFRYLSENGLQIPFKTEIVHGCEKLVFNKQDENTLRLLGQLTVAPYRRNSNGTYSPYVNQNEVVTDSVRQRERRGVFIFRGEPVIYEIKDYDQELTMEITKYPSPELVDYLYNKINKEVEFLNSCITAYELE